MSLLGVREVHQLDAPKCLELLGTINIGRVSLASEASSLGFPVNYALDGETILFRAGRRAKREVPEGATVLFTVDFFDSRYSEGWSVSVNGIVETSAAAADERYPVASPWMNTGESAWMRLRPYAVTGRKISSKSAL